MIKTKQVLRKGTSVLLGIGLDNAVLDILTNDVQLHECLRVLREPHLGLISVEIGTFGIYPVTLNVHQDDTVSIFLDGPYHDQTRNQTAGVWLEKKDLQHLLVEAVHDASSSGGTAKGVIVTPAPPAQPPTAR